MIQAKVTAKRARDGVWDLVVEHCPYCGKRHSHGGGNGEQPFYGNRLSHCLNNERDYELVPGLPPGTSATGRG